MERADNIGKKLLTEVTQDNLFDLHKVDGTSPWMPPPSTMETMMIVYNQDRMAHARNLHVFAVSGLMAHLWMKHLGKDADFLMTIATEDHFWGKSQHKLLILAIAIPLAYV